MIRAVAVTGFFGILIILAYYVFIMNNQRIFNTAPMVAAQSVTKGPEASMWVQVPPDKKWYKRGGEKPTYPSLDHCVREIPFVYKRDPRMRNRKLTCCTVGVNPNHHKHLCTP